MSVVNLKIFIYFENHFFLCDLILSQLAEKCIFNNTMHELTNNTEDRECQPPLYSPYSLNNQCQMGM